MSEISDELRECADTYDDKVFLPKLNRRYHDLADRIDAEMVELPRDKDGEPIHLGDTVYDKDGLAWHVRGVTLTYDAASISNCVIRAGSEKGDIRGLNPEMVTHERPDSLERIADELDDFKLGRSLEDLRAIADRIRKLAKEREHE